MDKSSSEQFGEYLKFFLLQPEAGLLVFNADEELREVSSLLGDRGFVVTNSWAQTLNAFKDGQSVALAIEGKLTPDLYSLIVQYSDRAGEIQIMNSETMILEQVEFDPKVCHLLVLVASEILKKIEVEFNIKEKVGLIEIIK